LSIAGGLNYFIGENYLIWFLFTEGLADVYELITPELALDGENIELVLDFVESKQFMTNLWGKIIFCYEIILYICFIA
jgi:hypothetical protein